jgi:hypothetical protein
VTEDVIDLLLEVNAGTSQHALAEYLQEEVPHQRWLLNYLVSKGAKFKNMHPNPYLILIARYDWNLKYTRYRSLSHEQVTMLKEFGATFKVTRDELK